MAEREIDLTDKKKFKRPIACVWWMGGVRNACGEPLGEGDIAFCDYHRRLVRESRWRDETPQRY